MTKNSEKVEPDVIRIGEDEEPPITLTEAAIIAVKEFIQEPDIEGDGLRVGVRGGGCAGLQFALDFSYMRDGDYVMDFDGLQVYCDPVSMMHLEGTTVDYVTGLMGAGFKFDNPHATRTCGCGSSFM